MTPLHVATHRSSSPTPLADPSGSRSVKLPPREIIDIETLMQRCGDTLLTCRILADQRDRMTVASLEVRRAMFLKPLDYRDRIYVTLRQLQPDESFSAVHRSIETLLCDGVASDSLVDELIDRIEVTIDMTERYLDALTPMRRRMRQETGRVMSK